MSKGRYEKKNTEELKERKRRRGRQQPTTSATKKPIRIPAYSRVLRFFLFLLIFLFAHETIGKGRETERKSAKRDGYE